MCVKRFRNDDYDVSFVIFDNDMFDIVNFLDKMRLNMLMVEKVIGVDLMFNF